jgi:hypothetical protein
MKQIINVFVIFTVLILPGCGGTLVDLTKETFPQGEQYKDHKKLTKHYLRDINIYDQFTTLALFDALWLSDEIRTIYTDVYAQMLGKTTDAKNAFLRRQLKANNHFISFYVLSTHGVQLSAKPIPWALHLEIDGKKYLPFEVKAIELPVQYQMLFGRHFNKHKQAYEVKFDRNDADGKDVLQEGKPHSMKMFFSSASHYDSASWTIDGTGKVPCPTSHKISAPRPKRMKRVKEKVQTKKTETKKVKVRSKKKTKKKS